MWFLFEMACILFDKGDIPLSCDELACDIKKISLRIEPQQPNVTDTLICLFDSAISAEDIGSYRWTHEDGTPLGQNSALPLSPTIVQKRDRISCSVVLNSPDYEALKYEAEVQIANSPPSILDLGISPAVPVLSYDGLFCVPTVSDIDGDELIFTHQWMLNGEIFSDVQADGIISQGDIHPGDRWQCQVSVSDGETTVQESTEDYVPVETISWSDIPSQTAQVGSPNTEQGRDLDETLRMVTLSEDYLMMTTEMTENMSAALTGLTFESDCWDCPVSGLNWDEAAAIANQMSEYYGLQKCYSCSMFDDGVNCQLDMDPYTCGGVRLPTEAEWEIAARAQSTTAFHAGNMINAGIDCFDSELTDQHLGDIAWYCDSASEVQIVGQLIDNPYGLFDLHGNLWEWTNDSYTVWGNADTVDPFAYQNNTRVIKGGSFVDFPYDLRSASRRSVLSTLQEDYIGFRFVRVKRGR